MGGGDTLAATAVASTAFTFCGCFSVMFIGTLKDLLPKEHRAAVLVIFILPLTLTLAFLSFAHDTLGYSTAVVLMSLAGAFLAGPYKQLGPVFAVDVAGKDCKGTAMSLIGMSNDVSAITLSLIKGQLGSDWGPLFAILACMSCVALIFALWIWRQDTANAARAAKAEALLAAGLKEHRALSRRLTFHALKNND